MSIERDRSVLIDSALAWAGTVGPILFVVGFTVAGWFRSGYSATRGAISDLGVGPAAWAQNANFLVFGGLVLMFALGFARLMPGVLGHRQARVGAGLIAATAVGIAASGVFPAAPPTEGLHFLLGFLLAFGSAIATTIYVARKLRGVPGWQGLARYSRWTAIGAAALIVLSFVALNPASPLEEAGVGGLIERALVIEVFAWHAVTGWRLSRHAEAVHSQTAHRVGEPSER